MKTKKSLTILGVSTLVFFIAVVIATHYFPSIFTERIFLYLILFACIIAGLSAIFLAIFLKDNSSVKSKKLSKEELKELEDFRTICEYRAKSGENVGYYHPGDAEF